MLANEVTGNSDGRKVQKTVVFFVLYEAELNSLILIYFFKIQLKTIEITTRQPGNKPHNSIVYSKEP